MTPVTNEEFAVAVCDLDDWLKLILRQKIREFIHLTPQFEAVPKLDFAPLEKLGRLDRVPMRFPIMRECPYRRLRPMTRRRPLRPAAVF